MRFLNMLRKQRNLTEDAKMYIAKYKIICKRIIRETKRKKMVRIYCMQNTNLKLYGRLYTRKLGGPPQINKILLKLLSPTNAPLYYTYKILKCTVKISHDCSYMFRSICTIIREPMLNLAKATVLWR
jgi:hypothetical protein